MTNFSNTSLSLSPEEDGPLYGKISANTWTMNNNISGGFSRQNFSAHDITFIVISCLCIIGMVENGIVISLLGFYIKRSPFMTYILNLAVADFGVLLFASLLFITELIVTKSFLLFIIAIIAGIFMNGASQLLLTAISIDRCVSILFPIWYRCHRPPHLSPIVCALIWVLAFLLLGSLAIFYILGYSDSHFSTCFYQFIVGVVFSMPLVTVSTVILFLKVFCKSQQPRRGRILTIVFLTLFFFLIFFLPLNFIVTSSLFNPLSRAIQVAIGGACLNSCVNPVIYYMVGRKKRSQQRQSLKFILQRAFKEEEKQREERGHHSSDIMMTPS